MTYVRKMAEAVSCTRSIADVECGFEVDMIRNLTNLSTNMYKKMRSLEELIAEAPQGDDQRLAEYYRDAIIPAMDRLRAVADEIERLSGRNTGHTRHMAECCLRYKLTENVCDI